MFYCWFTTLIDENHPERWNARYARWQRHWSWFTKRYYYELKQLTPQRKKMKIYEYWGLIENI